MPSFRHQLPLVAGPEIILEPSWTSSGSSLRWRRPTIRDVAQDSRLRSYFRTHPMATFVVGEVLLIFEAANSAGRLHYLATGPRSLDRTQMILVLTAAALPLVGVVAASLLAAHNPQGAARVKAALAAGLLGAVVVALPGRYSHQYYFAPSIQVVGDAYALTMCSILAIYLVRIRFWRGGKALFTSPAR